MDIDTPRVRRLPLWMGLAAFLLYIATGARTIQWQDSAQFTYRIATQNPDNIYGLAMVHPLHYMLGRAAAILFPSNLPWALSGVSALGGAVAVGLTTACARMLQPRGPTALFTGITLMLAHTFWRFSCLPEVYTLSAALMMAQVTLLIWSRQRKRPIPWAGILALNGVAFANHNLALLTLAVWGGGFLLMARTSPQMWRLLPRMAVAWIMGSLPYTMMIVQEAVHSGDLMATIHSALFGHGFREEVSTLFPRPAFTAISLAFMFLSFPGLSLPLAVRSWRRRQTTGVSLPGMVYALAAVQLGFFLRYDVIDQYTFLVPVFPLLALMAGCGFATLTRRGSIRTAWVFLALQIPLYAISPWMAETSGVLKPFARNKPFRNDAQYLLWPWRSQDRSAHQLAEAALHAALPDGTIVMADPMATHTLQWMRREMGLEADIRLLRPQDHEAMLVSLQKPSLLVWAPSRSTDPAPPGWREENGVWIAETGAKPPSTP